MKKNIDRAWVSLIFSIPGSLLAVFIILFYTGLTASRPGTGDAGFWLALWALVLLPSHFILLIPAWLVLRTSTNKTLTIQTKVFFDLLTLFVVFPFFADLARDLNSHAWRMRLLTLVIAAAFVLSFLFLGWFLIYMRFRKNQS